MFPPHVQHGLCSEQKTITRCFFLVLVSHLIIWTVLPTMVRHALPNDLIEAYLWSQQNALGYDKNPWMPALIAKLGVGLGAGSGWGYYFLQQLVVVSGLFAAFQLIRACSNIRYAFLGVLMLEACICYTAEVQIMNDNFLLLGLLPLACWALYLALHYKKKQYWMCCGLLFALTVMSKYNAILVVIGGLVYVLCYRRYELKNPDFYLALGVFMLVVMPNAVWLWQHGFSTLHYAFVERGRLPQYDWLDGLYSGLSFVYMTFINWLPGLILLLLGLCYRKQNSSDLLPPVDTDAKRFIFWVGVFPFFLMIFLAVVMGFHLHREWGTTFLGFMGAYVLFCVQPCVSFFSLMRFMVALVLLMVSVATAFTVISLNNNAGNYPATTLTRAAEQAWHQHMNTPLKVIAGDRYVIGHIVLQSREHPRAWMEWNFEKSLNLNQHDVDCHGALFVQTDFKESHSAYYPGNKFPEFILKRYPNAHILPEIALFRPKKTNDKEEPIKVIFAILKPIKVC